MRNQCFSQTEDNLLGPERNEESLLQFFLAHSKVLKVSQSSSKGVDVKEHLSSIVEE